MGLDAVVFRSARNLSTPLDSSEYEVDGRTGELTPKSERAASILKREEIALHVRLGNVAEVSFLAELVSDEVHDSVLQSLILYSGTHSGDVIPPALHEVLRSEIEILKTRQIPSLATLLASLEALLETADRESNPIVFT